ncbi:hypothetical protein MPTK1_5g23890 [Marchantia polymorpha subsp. ruderalis]|uniref:Endonuclease/exonuclease/phosphatase domain-containing protein n=2 Tax=Marchantia polymorpha TaxID=3197 RepID=A0AAF6BLM3_MARPO|nr:hypothetical protein MARPO_0010s0066 [Marchantia polymorpha]BBN12907.1 hypothetical protein Mp_5g23890 [Marchantia polymorpha subsp. ruderalis]|eukprot:PTQ46664.1 hypothetical protein MARPO_0010s0066 [Marchantia polymorpha]
MLPLLGLSGAALACTRLFRGYVSLSIRRSNLTLEIVASARRLTTLQGKMTAAKCDWKPNFVPVADTIAFTDDPKCLLRIVSYNILAQAYVKSANFPHSPRSCLRWKNRSEAVVSRLLALDADLLCLQELDEYHTFYKEILDKAGYGSVYVQRGNKKKDGCGIFFKRTRVSLLSEEIIDYNVLVPPLPPGEKEVSDDEVEDGSGDEAAQKIGDLNDVRVRLKRDCVGILAAFKPLEAPDHVFVLANTHIFWDPVLMDVKLAQVHHLADSLVTFKSSIAQEQGVDPLVFVTGDFNSLPGDSVYKYLTSGTDLSDQPKALEEDVKVLEDKLVKLDVQSKEENTGEVKEWVVKIDQSSKFPLPTVSLYAYADEEPPFTNYTVTFVGTLDYILFVPSERLKPRTLLALPKPGALEVLGGLPNHNHPSDHLPIGCDFGLY